MSLERRLEVMEAENDRLRARVADLEKALLGEAFVAPLEWGLTGTENRVMGVLLAREFVTKVSMMTALYDERMDRETPLPKITDVLICKLRRKLGVFDVRIETQWGLGWRLRAQDRARLRGEIAERRRA